MTSCTDTRAAIIEQCALAAMDGGPCSCPTPCDEYFGYAGVRCPKGTADKIRALKNTCETVAASSVTPEHVTGTSLSSERDSQFPPELATKIRHRTLVTGLRALGDAICVEAADVIEQLEREGTAK